MISQVKGDLFDQDLAAIAHGCNCLGAMGAGIAVKFRQRNPQMYLEYRSRCKNGNFRLGDVFWWPSEQQQIVFNLATQIRPGPHAEPWAITTAIGQMIKIASQRFANVPEIGIPYIGCGYGGLERDQLLSCLQPFNNAPVGLVLVDYR